MSVKRLLIMGLLGVLLLGVGVTTVGLGDLLRDPSGSASASPDLFVSDERAAAGWATPTGVRRTTSPAPEPMPTTARPEVSYPQAGGGKWTIATGRTTISGRAGRLMRFQVAVEKEISGVDAVQFAAQVFATLGDPRGWTAGGGFRFQRVGPGEPRDFTVYLATPATRDALCADGYDRYTSCRKGDRVVLNVARWAVGVPHYGADLDVYRAYMVNHEVGHRLWQGHELCPGKGRLAPVMQQQTLGLHGCVANAWPYVDGSRYAGRSGAYDDPVPRV